MAKRVVVACEFSGTVREAFRKRGFHAVSVDLLPAADGMNGWHFQTDILKFLATSAPFDLMIAHPPCTYLCNSGVCWLHPATGHRTKKNYTDAKCLFRWINLQQSVIFFNALKDANIPHIAIENPIPHKFATGSWATRGVGQQCRGIGKYDQIIQPWQFGHPETKATCLWLKNLPKLQPTRVVSLPEDRTQRMRLHYLPPSKDRWKIRSVTYQGIADAMAQQWGDYINEGSN